MSTDASRPSRSSRPGRSSRPHEAPRTTLPAWAVRLVLVAGILVSGIGIALLGHAAASSPFAWTADASLSQDVSGSAGGSPWLLPAAMSLVLLGAGTAGSAATALFLTRQPSA